MSKSDKVLTPKYLDWHAKLSGLPSISSASLKSVDSHQSADFWTFSEQDFEGIELLDSTMISDFGFDFWEFEIRKTVSVCL
ncbi:hypothetical protein RhiirA1_477522 [Rhizophagus irregularis]|uniref:Uncharacterized protein n=1 Tax=Rhizophagus irregularis TaxID=588596 RepID=A0A2N0QTE9_9GLOM|nr:hypothetical protein RhiirA1_477522 [Rhizophagus irregularis]